MLQAHPHSSCWHDVIQGISSEAPPTYGHATPLRTRSSELPTSLNLTRANAHFLPTVLRVDVVQYQCLSFRTLLKYASVKLLKDWQVKRRVEKDLKNALRHTYCSQERVRT